MIESIIKELNIICISVTRNDKLKDDLKQEVLLFILEKTDFKERFENDKKSFFLYLYGVAYKMWNFPKSDFYRKQKQNFHLNIEDGYYAENTEQPLIDKINESIDSLSEINQLWVTEYLKCNCSKSELKNKTGVNRTAIANRLGKIFKKIKENV